MSKLPKDVIAIIDQYECGHYSKPYAKYYGIYLAMKEATQHYNTNHWCSDCKKVTKVTSITPYEIYLRKEKLLKIKKLNESI